MGGQKWPLSEGYFSTESHMMSQPCKGPGEDAYWLSEYKYKGCQRRKEAHETERRPVWQKQHCKRVG